MDCTSDRRTQWLIDDELLAWLYCVDLKGKCLYDSVLVDLPLAKFFLSKLLGKQNCGMLDRSTTDAAAKW
jgi:hypothetical protein